LQALTDGPQTGLRRQMPKNGKRIHWTLLNVLIFSVHAIRSEGGNIVIRVIYWIIETNLAVSITHSMDIIQEISERGFVVLNEFFRV
jgi:hypothetical protein